MFVVWEHKIVKMILLPKLVYRFHAIPFKISATYLMNIANLILKFVYREKISRNIQ